MVGNTITTNSTDLLLNTFAPRNGGEMRRIITSNGTLIVVSPNRQHLMELVGVLDLLIRR